MDNGEVQEILQAQLLFEEGVGEVAPPQLVRVRGRAASGKSTLLQEMAQVVREHYGNPASAVIVAPTKNAANAVQGKTLHSAFHIPWEVTFSALEEPQLSSLRNSLDGLHFILVDNAQQVNNHVLYFADRRLRQVFDGNADKPFAGRYVYLFEDERSWGPVPSLQHAQYSSIRNGFYPVNLSNLWLDDASFANTLRHLRNDQVTHLDVARMGARHLDVLPASTNQAFRNAIAIVGWGDFDINMSHLNAIDGSEFYFGEVPLKIGARVVLTAPLGSLLAGSTGEVEGRDGDNVLVRFDSVPNPISVPPSKPLIYGWAVNLAKAMGLRFDRVIVRIPDDGAWAGDTTFLYAALSRAKRWSGLALRGPLENLPEVNMNED